jgi:exostosin family protein
VLRVYSERALVPDGEPHVLALAPLWGPPSPPPWPARGYADALAGSGVFVAAELADADVAIFPRDWKHARASAEGVARALAFVDAARAAGKPCVFFWASDSTDAFPFDDVVVFRPSLFRSRRGRREFALPGFHEDLLGRVGGELPLRERRDIPTVSFCGHAVREPTPRGALARGRRLVGDVRRAVAVRTGIPLKADIFVRRRALERLSSQSLVDTNIVLRDEYHGVATADPERGPALWETLRAEYVDSIVESDYVLCARGNGNYSYRLYEALCLGRIPVFVDTDCVLPYDFAVDWRDHVLWLTRRDVPRIAERIRDFHARLSPDDFVELQRRGRQLWEQYLSPLGFFRNFHRHFGV